MMTVGDSQTMITMAVEGIGVCGQRNKGKSGKERWRIISSRLNKRKNKPLMTFHKHAF